MSNKINRNNHKNGHKIYYANDTSHIEFLRRLYTNSQQNFPNFKKVSEPINAINSRLQEITEEELNGFIEQLSDTNNVFYQEELIFKESFPYLLLRAFLDNKLSKSYVSTMLILWSTSREFIIKENLELYKPRFIKFDSDNENKINICAHVGKSLIRNFRERKDEQMTSFANEVCSKLPENENGCWVFENFKRSENSILNVLEGVIEEYFYSGKIYQDDNFIFVDIIPNFHLIQNTLIFFGDEPLKVNPVLGVSSVNDIGIGTRERHRDVSIPFPGYHYPKKADGYNAGFSLEFVRHDLYHLMKSSIYNIQETKEYLNDC